jgi:hypothetical protein
VASIEAQIAIILKGTSELKKLQSRLDGIQTTIDKISGQRIEAVIEGTGDVAKYSSTIKGLSTRLDKLTAQQKEQASATNKSNAEIKQAIKLESQLRRERSLVSRFTREFTIETKGLDQTQGQLKDIKDRFDNLKKAFGKAFELQDPGIIKTLKNELSSLVQEQRDWNRTLTGTKKTGINADFLKEQAKGYKEQIDALRARARVLGQNEDIINKLGAAERNLVTGRSKEGTFLGFADPRLGKQQLDNVKQLISLQERQAKGSGDAAKENEKLSSAAVALDKQRQSALERIFQVEEKIRSSKRISAKEAQDYYFQAQLPRTALPFGDVNQPAMRGGARRAGPSMIQGRAEPRIREFLGGARTADEAETAFRLIEEEARKTGKAIKESFVDAYKAMLPPDTVLTGLEALGKAGQTLASMKVRGGGQSGLEAALGSLQEARGARERFLGGASPAEAIDQIVREFNTGKPAVTEAAGNITQSFSSGLKKGAAGSAAAAKAFATAAAQAIKNVFGIKSPSRFMIELVQNLVNTYIAEMQKSYPRIEAATERAFGQETLLRDVKKLTATNKGFELTDRTSTGFRPLAMGAGTEGISGESQEMMSRFRKDIAGLTTQPEIYQNLLNALPDSRITTDLAGAANRRALASEQLPSFMPTQRMLGPGELEGVIAKAAADYFRTVRTPDPWVGLVGDYKKNFVDKMVVLTQQVRAPLALPAARIAGALPPALFESGLSPAQELRRLGAYRRSEERSAAVMGEGGPRALSSALFESGLSPAQELRRQAAYRRSEERSAAVMGGGSARGLSLPSATPGGPQLALPPAAERGLQDAISDLFDRISNAVRGAFGGSGGPRPPIGGGPGGGFYNDPGDLARRATEAAQQGPEALLGLKELAAPAKVSTKELEALSAILKEFRSVLDPTVEGFDQLNKRLRNTAANIDRQLERRAPDADFLTSDFGPRTGAAISEGLIGGAFPLLFGQGAGASVGGGLGGALGGFAGGGLGFGLSLIGTALGTAFDTAVQSATELGAAINDVSTIFDKVKEKSLFSSRETEKYAAKLQEAGLVASASALAQQEIIKKIGASGVKDLSALESESDRLNRQLGELALQMQALVAGPLAAFIEKINEALSVKLAGDRAQGVVNQLFSEGKAEEARRLASRVNEITNQNAGNGPRIASEVSLATDEARKSLAPAKIEQTPQLIKDQIVASAKAEIDALNAELEAIDIGKKLADQVKEVARQQEDLNQQAFDTRKQYEEAIGDIRLNIERTAQRESLDNVRAQNELYQVQGEIRLQQLSNASQALVSEQGVNDYGRRLLEILGQAASLEVSTQQDIENKKRQFQLELQSKEIDAEIFKSDIAKQVAKLSEDSQKRIAEINKGVRRSNEQYDLQRFKIEKTISDLRIKQIEAELSFNKAKVAAQLLSPSADPKVIADSLSLLEIYEAQGKAIEKSKQTLSDVVAPAKLQEVGGFSTQGVSTVALDAVRERAAAFSRELLEANERLIGLAKAGQWQDIKNQFAELADQGYKSAVIELQDIVEAVANGGDAFAGAAARLAKSDKLINDSLNSIGGKLETSLVKEYRAGGLTDGAIRSLLQLASQFNLLASEQADAARTAKFYADSISAVQSQIESLTQEIKEATDFGSNYEQALRSLADRGLSLVSKEARSLVDAAQRLDVLEEKAAVLRGIQAASEGLAGSMRGLIENFYELGSASEAVKAFGEEMSKKALGFVLDIAFKPVEENIRKSLIMFGEKIGFDFSTPAERQLTELEKANLTIGQINANVKAFVDRMLASQPVVTPTDTPGVNQYTLPDGTTFRGTPKWFEDYTRKHMKEGQSQPASQAAQDVSRPASMAMGAQAANNIVSGPAFQNYLKEVQSRRTPFITQELKRANSRDEVIARGEALRASFKGDAPTSLSSNPEVRGEIVKTINALIAKIAYDRIQEIGASASQAGAGPGAALLTGSGAPGDPMPLGVDAFGASSEAAQQVKEGLGAVNEATAASAQSLTTTAATATSELRKNNAELAGAVPEWGKNLGGVVSGLSLAATGVIGILGGIQQIKEGGTSNVLSGIGGILTTIGGIGLSVAGMIKTPAANGAAFANGMASFAKGGTFTNSIVSSPTLFKFANGGTTQMGEMGEAGPEAIMPLSRGRGGRLGVDASGLREAMGRPPGGATGSPVLNMSFQSTTINGVEYVSRDQLEAAMVETRRQAAKEGANRGMSMTLDKLQQSPSTRSRLGMGGR